MLKIILTLKPLTCEGKYALYLVTVFVYVLVAGKIEKNKDLSDFDKSKSLMAQRLHQSTYKGLVLVGCI